MSARFGLVGQNHPGPIWAHLGQFFAWAGKIKKIHKFCLFSLVGHWAPFTRFGPMAAFQPLWAKNVIQTAANKLLLCQVIGFLQPTDTHIWIDL